MRRSTFTSSTLLVGVLLAWSLTGYGQVVTIDEFVRNRNEVIVKNYVPKLNDRVFVADGDTITYDSVATYERLKEIRKEREKSNDKETISQEVNEMVTQRRTFLLWGHDELRILDIIPAKPDPASKPKLLVVEVMDGQYAGTYRVVRFEMVVKTAPRPPVPTRSKPSTP